jgi:trimeric autotransporter adhesin
MTIARATVLASAAALAMLAGQATMAVASTGQASGAASKPGTISTVAGGIGGPGTATSVSFYSPYTCGTVQYAAGHLYIGDQGNDVVRSVSVRTDWLTNPAGNGFAGDSGDGGPATKAELSAPCAATADAAGDVIIADKDNGKVRIVAGSTGHRFGLAMTKGHIYTLMSGSKSCRVSSTSGTFCPIDVITDSRGNVLVSSEGSEDPRNPGPAQVFVIAAAAGRFYGHVLSAGANAEITGGGAAQIAVDKAGNILLANVSTNRVSVYAARNGRFYGRVMKAGHVYAIAGNGTEGGAGDDGPALKAELNNPDGVAVDHAGNVVIGDNANGRVRVVAERTGTFYGKAMKAGYIYTIAGKRRGKTGNGIPASAAKLADINSVGVDNAGNIVLAADIYLAKVVAVRTGRFYGQAMKAGHIYNVAGEALDWVSGEGLLATRAELGAPVSTFGVTTGRSGNTILAGARVWVVPARSGTFYGRKMTAQHIYVLAGGGSNGLGNGGPARKATVAGGGVVVDHAGNIVFCDDQNNMVRMVAERTGTFYGRAVKAGDIYAIAGTGSVGSTGDGGPAWKAKLFQPADISLDPHGNLVIADTYNGKVRVVAAASGTFYGQAMTAGDIYTVAGGGASAADGVPATSASLAYPRGVAVDKSGNLVISDTADGLVRIVAEHTGTFYGQAMKAGDIYTVGGGGSSSANGVPATSATISPDGVTVDAAGNLVIADEGSFRVRVIAPKSGTFYGQAMTAGDIYTVAGNGTSGFSGDGGLATAAELADPTYVAVTGQSGLLIADRSNGRLRAVSG